MKKLRLVGISALLGAALAGGGLAPAAVDAWFGGPSFYAKEGQAFNLTSLAHPWGGSWNDRISSHDEAY
jgi:hypothetical protein